MTPGRFSTSCAGLPAVIPWLLLFARFVPANSMSRSTARPMRRSTHFCKKLCRAGGLYYYACSIKNRRAVAGKVIAPLFQQLLKSRFSVTHDHSLRRHILGTLSDELIPSEMADPFANKYDCLFRKWDLRMITDY